jgi:trigger factor
MSEWTIKEHSKGELVVTIEGDAWKDACRKAFRKIARGITVPGFRKGTAPEKILRKYVSKEQERYEAIEANANQWLQDALKEKGLEPVSRPSLDFRNMGADSVDLVFEFYVEPEVKLGEYKGLPYDLGDINVTDEDVEKELDRMRETYADMETVDGPAEDGDTVNIDYEGRKDDIAFDGGSAEGFDLRLGSGSFIPGFEDQLIGVKAGEEKELNLTFPEDYTDEELAGEDVVFKVKVNEVKRKVLPELDDDFAKDVNAPGVETVEDLRKAARERIEDSRKEQAEHIADEELFKKLSESAEIDIPQVMIDDEAMSMVKQMEAQIAQYGMQPAQYLKMLNQTEEQLAETFKEEAERNVRLRLILAAIAEAEQIEVTDEETEAEINKLAEAYGMEPDRVRAAIDSDLLAKDIKNQKASEFVKEHAARS